MASTTQDELYQAFLAVSGQQTSALGDATAMLANVIAQVDELQSSNPAPVTAQSTTTSSSNDGGSTLGSVAASVLESGFGLAPLISGLVSLFSGGDTAAPAPLVKYAMPAAADFQGAESQGQVTGVDYDQTGMPRSYAPAGASAESERQCRWCGERRGSADHGQRAGDGCAVFYGPEQRHCAGGAGRDVESELDQRCSE